MTVRRRIFVLVFTAFLVMAASVAFSVMAFRSVDHFATRIDAVHRRFEVIAELIGLANDYGEQVAEQLLLGRDTNRELDTAKIDLERAFARLSQVTRAEFATIGQTGIDRELRELENARRMVEVYHAIDASAARAFDLVGNGDRERGLGTFEREVAFRLSNELQPLLTASLDGERQEVVGELAAMRRQQDVYFIAGVVFGVFALAALGFFGWLLHLAINRPVRVLTTSVDALAAGDYGKVVPLAGNNELAVMTRTLAAAAETLRTQSGGLAAAMDTRTAELHAANERLRDVDTRRTQFLADVSHELRTPLTILRGEADVALRGQATPEEQRQSLELIRGQASDLSQLLDELIAFARSDAEAQDYVTAETRLDRVIAAAVQEGEVLAATREIKVTVTLGDEGAAVDADFRRLKQALIIGLDNAVKHSPPGSRIDVATGRGDGHVTIAIDDEGPGIAPGEEARVFERFYRGSSEDAQGLGIGLAIARGIVERHRGTIALANRPGGGARLEIALPVTGSAP
jgi:signal transduction histidine kinase